MATSRELREQRAKIIEAMKEAVKLGNEARAKGESASDYDKAFDKAEADERALSKQIDALMRIEEDEKRAAGQHMEDLERHGRAGNDPVKKLEYRDAYKVWFTQGNEGLTPEMRALMAEKRGTSTQVVGTTTLGGYFVPEGFIPQIETALKDYSGIFEACDVFRTASGNPLPMPTEDDTSTEATLTAEAASITVQDLTIGQKMFDAYSYKTQMKLSWELMQDSAFDMDAHTRATFGPRFGRAINSSCTTGDGSSKPNGVVTASSLGKTAASATAITFQEVIDLKHSVDPAYRRGENSGYMLHDSVLAVIKKLSIGTGDARPLWQPSYREGAPDMIDGSKYWINQAMDSTVDASSKVMLYGDFSKYRIRLVQELLIIRLNERYADNGLVGFVGFMRWDGECVNTAAIKHLITAAS